MGLDMYLEGRTYNWQKWDHPELNPMRDGFRIKGITLELGYWRKHPDLHGYIVEAFANGVDECQDIELTKDNLLQIIGAIKGKKLPHTEGFFFGKSDGTEAKESIHIFEQAIEWMEGEMAGDESRNVVYRASW